MQQATVAQRHEPIDGHGAVQAPTLRRRSVLPAMAGALALSACAAPPGHAPASKPAMATAFVLVHGATLGGWSWQRVQAHLQADGHRVYAQSLTGLGDRSHLLHRQIGLDTHVTDVVNLVEWEGLLSIVLCGHSYGGMVITGVAERLLPRIKAIVYLDAFVPDAPNRSLLDLSEPASRARREAVATQSGILPPVPLGPEQVNQADKAWVDSKCTSQPFLTFQQGLPSVEAHERVPRKVYVRATGFPTKVYDRLAADRRGRPGWTVEELPFGHCLMFDAPRQVADLLIRAAGA